MHRLIMVNNKLFHYFFKWLAYTTQAYMFFFTRYPGFVHLCHVYMFSCKVNVFYLLNVRFTHSTCLFYFT